LEINVLEKTWSKAGGAGMADAMNDSMMHKVSILPAMMLLLVAAIAAKVRSMIDAQVPMGYQDETGFHAGVKAANDSTWPSSW
jgi:hypothetical protein